jgi:biopolymer transport protein ExbD
MSAQVQHDDESITAINVTPLVDVTLVLLVVFMVTAKLIAGHGIPVDLPKAATAGVTQTVFTVSVDASGHIAANGKSVDDDAVLREQARTALMQTPELRTVISASASASHGAVMHAVDVVREAGIVKLAFAADPAAGSAGLVPVAR